MRPASQRTDLRIPPRQERCVRSERGRRGCLGGNSPSAASLFQRLPVGPVERGQVQAPRRPTMTSATGTARKSVASSPTGQGTLLAHAAGERPETLTSSTSSETITERPHKEALDPDAALMVPAWLLKASVTRRIGHGG